MAKKISIIGAGMSGLITGIMLAKYGHKVTIFERNNKIGKKILVTGNGRCNLSNENISKLQYHSMTSNIFDLVYEQFNLKQTKELFEEMGIDFVKLENGKLYPRNLQAKSVVQALLMECEKLNINIIYNVRISKVTYTNKFKITVDNKVYYSYYLVIATGGKSYGDSGSTGDGYKIATQFNHNITKTFPSIVQLKTDYAYNKTLKGLKVHAKGKLIKILNDKEEILREDEGEVLFTDYGLSGPVILQLSTKAEPLLSEHNSLVIELNLVTHMNTKELDNYLIKRLHRLSYRNVADALNGFINQRLIQPLLKSSNIEPTISAGDVTKIQRNNLVKQLKTFRTNVTGTYLWNQAQVTKGGINCLEIHDTTLESYKTEGLYLVGEVIDIDGDCGGYNLQWAISSGAVAAKSINEK